MRPLCVLAVALSIAGSASAAPNVANATQKGSLLIFPDIRIDDGWNTLIRISNDGNSDVDVICYWMDGNKNRVDFVFTITGNQAVWFDARTGNGTYQVNHFPTTLSNGLDNPFLVTPPALDEATDGKDPYLKGLLACWAIDVGATNQVKWNHLSGSATVYHPQIGAYEYNAYAFFAPTGLDLQPVGATPGRLNLNGVDYDSCPLYQIGQFTPVLNVAPRPGALLIRLNRLAVTGCTLNLLQDYVPVFTKYEFDVWNEDEVKFTGAFECADSWHETEFTTTFSPTAGGAIDSGGDNFSFPILQTYTARQRPYPLGSGDRRARGGDQVVTPSIRSLLVARRLKPPRRSAPSLIERVRAAAGDLGRDAELTTDKSQ
jgi:hypothetical protein